MDDFTNKEMATVVSYAIAFDNCEEEMRRFKSKFGKEGPQVRTLYANSISVMILGVIL